MASHESPDVRFDENTALVVVDVQNDFAHTEGNLSVRYGDATIPVINRLVDRAKKKGALIVYTQDWHPESTPHFEKDGGTWPVHCVKETWGARLHHDLKVEGPVIKKGTGGEDGYSGFSVRDPETGTEGRTELDQLLREHDVERIVLTGLAQDVCVKETALDARRLGYETILVADATRPVAMRGGDGARAVAEMVQAGVEVV